MWFWFAFPWLLKILIFSHIFLGICISSFMKCLVRSFVHVLIGLLVICSVFEFFTIMDINALPDASMTKIFSHSGGCLLAQKIAFIPVQIFFICYNPVCQCCFDFKLLESHLKIAAWSISPIFSSSKFSFSLWSIWNWILYRVRASSMYAYPILLAPFVRGCLF